MKILCVYSPEDSGFYRVWEKSWRLRGFCPGIITPKEIARHKTAKKAAAVRGVRLVCSARLINASFKRPRKIPARIPFKKYGSPGWETAPVILFPKDFSSLAAA